MHDIVLTTLNARYWHSSFGLRYLLANMRELTERTRMLEFGINDSLVEVLADILERRPRIVGIGVYIWNIRQVTELVGNLKRVSPEVIVVLGGPEVSYDTLTQPVTELADYVITGEGDLAFAELCRDLLSNQLPVEKIIHPAVPAMNEIQLPYHLYNAEDVANRVIYVEASRGCPFTCEFCLSALDIPVRQLDVDAFLAAMQDLLDRGSRQFKFVDRTFNLNLRVSRRILQFFLDQWCDGMFLHFEMIPDRLPESLRELIVQFPDGGLQFEIGVQTFNDEVGNRISRQQDGSQLEDNFRFLREHSGVHIHADLIVGLPGEDIDSFGRGFDRLFALRPQEIQVGLLKRLKGTPIVRHDQQAEMVYSDHPPFEILQTGVVDFSSMMRLRHFARTWDLTGNSGNFPTSIALLCRDQESPFQNLMKLSNFLVQREQRLQGISLVRLAKAVFTFMTEHQGISQEEAAAAIWQDYTRNGRSDRPKFLRAFDLAVPQVRRSNASGLRRQQRHQA